MRALGLAFCLIWISETTAVLSSAPDCQDEPRPTPPRMQISCEVTNTCPWSKGEDPPDEKKTDDAACPPSS
jgi:hypothetical protein